MKTLSILITHSGVAKLIPETVKIPERPTKDTTTAWLAYSRALTALEKEAIEFEDQEKIRQLMTDWKKYKANDKVSTEIFFKDRFKPGIYKEVNVPEYGIVTFKTWGEQNADGTWSCDSCCNGDRCDDPSHYYRKNCPICKGTGRIPNRQLIHFLSKQESEMMKSLPETASEPKCGDCGKELILVRPGKHQCDNSDCVQNEVTNSEGEPKEEDDIYDAVRHMRKVKAEKSHPNDCLRRINGIEMFCCTTTCAGLKNCLIARQRGEPVSDEITEEPYAKLYPVTLVGSSAVKEETQEQLWVAMMGLYAESNYKHVLERFTITRRS